MASDCPWCGDRAEVLHREVPWLKNLHEGGGTQRHAIQEQYDQLQFPDVFSDRRGDD